MTVKSNPIFNPKGPNMKVTEELIKTLSTVFESSAVSTEAKVYTNEMIQRLVEGYEIQSGEKYKGFLPDYKPNTKGS